MAGWLATQLQVLACGRMVVSSGGYLPKNKVFALTWPQLRGLWWAGCLFEKSSPLVAHRCGDTGVRGRPFEPALIAGRQIVLAAISLITPAH